MPTYALPILYPSPSSSPSSSPLWSSLSLSLSPIPCPFIITPSLPLVSWLAGSRWRGRKGGRDVGKDGWRQGLKTGGEGGVYCHLFLCSKHHSADKHSARHFTVTLTELTEVNMYKWGVLMKTRWPVNFKQHLSPAQLAILCYTLYSKVKVRKYRIGDFITQLSILIKYKKKKHILSLF